MTTHALVEDTFLEQQRFNEAIIRMMVLLYHIDGKITLTEQDFFSSTIADLNWQSGISLDAFINNSIHESRKAIDSDEARDFLKSIGPDLSINPAYALETATKLTSIDGESSDKEQELVSLLKNKILARGLAS